MMMDSERTSSRKATRILVESPRRTKKFEVLTSARKPNLSASTPPNCDDAGNRLNPKYEFEIVRLEPHATAPLKEASSSTETVESESGERRDSIDSLRRAAPYKSLDRVPCEPFPQQSLDFLKKTGVVLLVSPSGPCCFALSAYFASYLSGRSNWPFGAARYPGDVLFSTYTPDLERALRASLLNSLPNGNEVRTQVVPRRFDWEKPLKQLEEVLRSRTRRIAAFIVDAGPFPLRVPDTIAEDALCALEKAAQEADCLIMVVVESGSRNSDPFERLPRSLRSVRGALLVAPIQANELIPEAGAPSAYVILRLPEAAANGVTAQFELHPSVDIVDTARIEWTAVYKDDPRSAFRRIKAAEITNSQRAAIQVAISVVQQRGPTSGEDLQAAGQQLRPKPIAKTTMRDALTVASLYGWLEKVRNYDGAWHWALPGTHRSELPW
jgi:hypothetical protein